MEIIIDNESGLEFPPEYEKIIEKSIRETLLFEKLHTNVEVSVLILNNEAIKEINNERRFIDSETDVLSFPLLEQGDVQEAFQTSEIVYLGDIVISLEKAQFQAIDYGHSLEREIAFLTVHSTLHLLGYDHMANDEEEEMFTKQEEILVKAGYVR